MAKPFKLRDSDDPLRQAHNILVKAIHTEGSGVLTWAAQAVGRVNFVLTNGIIVEATFKLLHIPNQPETPINVDQD